MTRTRIDRFKVKKEMDKGKFGAFQDLADTAGISPTTLYSVLDSYSWRAATLDAVANALGVPSIALLTIDDADDDRPAAPAPKASDAARQTQRSALATPPQLAAEAQRRQILLDQAKGWGYT